MRVRYLVATMGSPERLEFLKHNRRLLPQLEACRSTHTPQPYSPSPSPTLTLTPRNTQAP